MRTQYRPEKDTLLVLNSGFVKYLDHMGGDEDIVAAARTSTGRGFVTWGEYKKCSTCGGYAVDTEMMGADEPVRHTAECTKHDIKRAAHDENLLKYLYVNRHMTPFEMCVGKFLVKAPIIFFRQLHRHRAASYNEMSARYTQLPNDFYVPRPEDVKRQSKSNKQGSEGKLDPGLAAFFVDHVQTQQAEAYRQYQQAIDMGIAPEMARINLPVSINSVCVVSMNLRMLLHMLGLRDDSHAQGLTQEVCRGIAEFARVLWPRTYALYEEHTKYAVTLSRTEHALLNAMLAPNADNWTNDAKKLFAKLKGTTA